MLLHFNRGSEISINDLINDYTKKEKGMKSIYRLHSFIQNNHHQILGLYILDQKVKFLRLVSNRTGEIFFLSLGKFEIELDAQDVFEPFIQNHCYYMSICEMPESETVTPYLDSVYALQPQLRSQMLFIENHFLYLDKDRVFELLNFPSKEIICYYFITSLEWFYENSLTIDHHLKKKKSLLYTRFHHLMTTSTDEIHKLASFLQKQPVHFLRQEKVHFDDFYKRSNNTKKLCIQIFQYTEKLYEEQDSISEKEAFTSFQDSIKKSFLKQKNQEDIRKAHHLKEKTLERLSFYQEQEAYHFLRLLSCLTEFTILMAKIYSFFTKFQMN